MNIDINVARKLLATVDAGLAAGLGVAEPGKMCVEAAVCYALGLPHGDNPDCVAGSLRKLKIRLNDGRWSSNKKRAKGLRRLALAQLGSAGMLDEEEFARRCAIVAIEYCVPVTLREAARLAKEPHKQAMLDAAEACEKNPTEANTLIAKRAATDAATDAAAFAVAFAAVAASFAAFAAAFAARAAAAVARGHEAPVCAADGAAFAASSAIAAAYAADGTTVCNAATYDTLLSIFAERIVQILIDMKAPGCQWLYLTENAD